MNCNGHIINDKLSSEREGAKLTINQMELIMRWMIGAFNRPNSYLLINIRQNVLQLVAVIRRVQHQQLQHMIYAYEVQYIFS